MAETYQATGSFENGSSRDITAEVVWSLTPTGTPITTNAAGGIFKSNIPGAFQIHATSGSVGGSATASVKVSGDLTLPGAPADGPTLLGGTPTGMATPSIAYPLDGSLFPSGFTAPEFQVSKGNANQSIGRVDFIGDHIDLRVVAPCAPIPNAPNGCAIMLEESIVPALAGASEGATMTARVRLVAPDGSALGESAPLEIRWTFNKLSGGIYYWRTVGTSTQTGVYRIDLDEPNPTPELFWSEPDSPPLANGQQHPCVGCHAISKDGTKAALTFGGSDPSNFGLVDVASKGLIAVRNTDQNGFATFSTFNPAGTALVNAFRGTLTLRFADTTLAAITSPLFPEIPEKLSEPHWSADGRKLAFVSWVPGQNGATGSTNGDLVAGGQIYVVDSDGQQLTGAPVLIIAREPGYTNYFPALSDDSLWLAYARSSCSGPTNPGPYGNGACDGYDDITARIRLASSAGGAPVELTRANGPETWVNSWPRFSPDHGVFRGKGLYWIAFSSRRPYGLRIPGCTNGACKPQLWFAAVTIAGDDQLIADPSLSPIWMPNQNDDNLMPTGNHVPQWTAKIIDVVPR